MRGESGGNAQSGVYGVTSHSLGNGVFGTNSVFNITGYLGGYTTGVEGNAAGITNGTGVKGTANSGGQSYGIWGISAAGYAGYFEGDVNITGNLTTANGSYIIDDPRDPEGSYLSHAAVESPEMMNIYNGNVRTDADGYALVELPDYFDALNRDFRYQLTVIGQFAQAIIAEEIHDGQFLIRTNLGQVRVSWQVTGIRQDAWATAHPMKVVQPKPAEEQGTYLAPEAYGLDAAMGIHAKVKGMMNTR